MDAFVSCAACGHQFPVDFVRQRKQVTCNCGMRIDSASFAKTPRVRQTALTLVILAVLAGLLTGAYAMARLLVG